MQISIVKNNNHASFFACAGFALRGTFSKNKTLLPLPDSYVSTLSVWLFQLRLFVPALSGSFWAASFIGNAKPQFQQKRHRPDLGNRLDKTVESTEKGLPGKAAQELVHRDIAKRGYVNFTVAHGGYVPQRVTKPYTP